MTITIKKVDNGYYVEVDFTDDEINKEHLAVSNIYTEEDAVNFKTTDEDKICLGRLLYLIADKIGVSYDKFCEENLNITWDKPGHKI